MKYVIALLLSLFASPALAGVSCVLPFNIQNGQPADATQVMANYNALVSCLTNAAAAGANSDITSLSGLTTPIPHSAGGTPVYIGTTSGGTPNAQTVSATVPSFVLNTGNIVTFVAGNEPTGPMTLNVQSTGAISVVRKTQLGIQPFVGGEFLSSDLVTVQYDGSQWQCLSCAHDMVGQMLDFAGVTAEVPLGWLAMDGSCQPQTTYPALFSVIGTTYGSCSAGLFALPDFRGNVSAAYESQGSNGTTNRLSLCGGAHVQLGGLCGIQSQPILQSNLPAINLSLATLTGTYNPQVGICNNNTCGNGDTNLQASSTRTNLDPWSNYAGSTSITFGGTLPLGGSGVALQTIQPLVFISKIIKL